MPEWLIGGLTVLVSASIPSVIVFFLSRINTEALGKRAGAAVTKFGNLKFGKGYEKVEGRLQMTLNDFVSGFNHGADQDD
jgi:hypothetical protein